MTPELQGPPPAVTRRAPSLLRCCTVLGILIASIVGLFFVVAVGDGLSKHYKSVVNPHRAHHHDAKAAHGSLAPVQPLFERETLFDVAATVWMQHSAEDLAEEVPVGLRVTHGVNETALASQIVLRGVSMKTLNAMSSIDFELPLAHFFLDLRGAITVIPTGHSKLDRVQEFSDWRPVGAEPFPRRSNPFPLGVSANENSDLSMREDIIEHWGASFPLLEFWEVETLCNVGDKEPNKVDAEEDDGSLQLAEESAELPTRADGEPVHKRHPHVVTRTHAFITDETRAYNRTSFDKQHAHLKKTACRVSPEPGASASWKNCFRNYDMNGHREMRLVLEPENGSKRKEVAYGPYLSKVNGGSGPRDVVPLPVTRENCTAWKSGEAPKTPDTMSVTWNIHFSGLTPGRLHLFENMVGRNRFPFNSTALAQAHMQKEWEQSVALFGQKLTPNHRPKTRFVVHALRQGMTIAAYLLTIAYWYTRTTTVGISVLGTAFFIASGVIESIAQSIWTLREDDTSLFFGLALSAFASFFVCLPAYFAAQAVSPVTLKWHSWRSVSLHRAVPTHRERASRRLDATLQPALKATILAAAFAILYTAFYFNLFVISPSLPAQTEKELGRDFAWRQFVSAVTSSLAVAGDINQCHLNHKAGTFGGSYRLATWFELGSTILHMVYLSQSIVGTFDASEGFAVTQVVHLILDVAKCYQAYTLPRVEQVEEEE